MPIQASNCLISNGGVNYIPQSDLCPPFTFSPQDTFYDAVVRDTIREEFPRIWLTGSLLAVGDALKDDNYFDHAPELELVYHLRNGVAHGNRFEFTVSGRKRLAEHPAHNRDAAFEITLALDGKRVLFDFIEAGDVLDLLLSVASHLDELGSRALPQPIVLTEAERLKVIEAFEKAREQPPSN